MKTFQFLLLSLCGLTTAYAQNADTIYHNGPIVTSDDANPRAEAVAVKDGKILAVGKKEDVLKTKGDETKLVDLSGKTMLPGFVDAHGHVFAGGIQALSANLLAMPDGKVKDIASLQQTLRDWMAANKKAVDKVQLVFGFGYDDTQLADLIILDKDPTTIDPEKLDTIKITQTIKEGNTVYLAGEKEGAHLSRPDERGEHAFSNFIRHAAAEEGHEAHSHAATESHCCGCKIAALLADALASSPGR